ncbi:MULTISPECIES: HPr family phosphocarrier protein [Bacillales]|jgi:phosphotransferase system HPr (HPr) family protein|uniref:HPr family phosphocarrier protein n=1 Tax=Brevibacillus TaxID=55080 RepID=UPI000E381C24|nr:MULTISPECIES: HPr family phosphocarrier protein [Bacillales]REK63312.1 MAG: HPr family phosphocarrier protein [Brevibacillus sp.]MBR8660858.1 HPr family phosphocarrier protein [Brevibacillus sp. NL20B1]MDT3414278.1 phosphotransferase system HPr (HPr) family protein [Brevibacillus aydinogluensis]NNV03457.1 HPr family phosphocarrier protein [Brevibacillus sp. MCWH]UFJ59878.1 HPr family phosphocarrier protein [Anoxybacillus sediminis]
MLEKQVIVTLPQGLHARPASAFVQTASVFASDIGLRKGGKTANGKSIISIMSLTVAQGEQVTLTADGPDEQRALEALEKLLTMAVEQQPGAHS